MRTMWIAGIGMVVGMAAAEVGCGNGTGGSGGGPAGMGGSPDTTTTTTSSTQTTGGSDRCHRTGVVASCDGSPQEGSPRECDEVFNQAQASSLMMGCASNQGTFSNGPCDRTGSVGFCVMPDLAGQPGDDVYYYDASLAGVAQGECTGILSGTWCPLP